MISVTNEDRWSNEDFNSWRRRAWSKEMIGVMKKNWDNKRNNKINNKSCDQNDKE